MFGYKAVISGNIFKFLKVIKDGGIWKVENNDGLFGDVNTYIQESTYGNIEFIADNVTPHEQRMMRMFMLSHWEKR